MWLYKQHPISIKDGSTFRIEVRGLPRRVFEEDLEPFAGFTLSGKYTVTNLVDEPILPGTQW
jgi:hypothetical protein